MLQLVSHERLFVRFPSPSNYTVRTFYLCYSRVRPHPADFGSRISGLTLIYNKKLLDGSPPTQLSDLVSPNFSSPLLPNGFAIWSFKFSGKIENVFSGYPRHYIQINPADAQAPGPVPERGDRWRLCAWCACAAGGPREQPVNEDAPQHS